MGCQLTKDDKADVRDSADMSSNNNSQPSAAAIKSQLDRKMCLAKETPEPVFDLSECHLKDCPSGVFVLCKVLRKQVLLLHRNQLSSLRSGGGQLGDLSLLRVLDLRENRLRSLPEEISGLTELRELFLSHNLLERLPQATSRLHKLEILEVSHNRLSSVAEVRQLASLRVLLLDGNADLRTLPASLATCDSLADIVVDAAAMDEPPARVCEQGTKAILNYLMGALNVDEIAVPAEEEEAATRDFLHHEQNSHLDRLVEQHLDSSKRQAEEKTQQLLSSERMALEKDYFLEAASRNQQDAKREVLLREIRAQQEMQESQISELNTQKNENRNNLIRDIIEEEERWKGLVQRSIEVQSLAVDPVLLEQEADEQARLLGQVKNLREELRRQEVLKAMQGLLESELRHVDAYQRQKANASSRVLTKETEKMSMLGEVLEEYQQNRNKIVDQIICDEQVQKSAVATLISRKDARSWALVEQMRIIESHLAAISTFEMEKRKEGSTQQLIDLAERRVMLSQVLLELMAQQDVRKRELVEMLARMEEEREGERKDFWLVQYQRLLDTQPENVDFDSSVDPELGLNFLTNGVIHCLPFLSRLWQDQTKTLQEIDEEELKAAGIRSESDRCGILKSIAQFLEYRREKGGGGGNGRQVEEEKKENLAEEKKVKEEATEDRSVDQEEQLAECVICMDKKVKIIFLLCGHLACCDDCHESVTTCPMCRAPIQQRIRVIQA